MSDKQPNGADWVASWIEQQRELLLRQSEAHNQAMGPESPFQGLGRRWLDLGESYLKGLAQYAAGGPQASTAAGELKLGDEILDAWRSAWAGAEAERDGAGRQFAELMDRLPLLGWAREQAQAWRELALADAECRRLVQELSAVLSRVQSDALALLQQRVSERRESGQVIDGFRALYDLWVECGEQVYGQVAHSDAYSKLQAALGNATMRMRARQQTVIEHALKQFDLPTRSELNSVHRQLRDLRARLAALEAAQSVAPQRVQRRAKSARSSQAIAKKSARESARNSKAKSKRNRR